MALIPPQTAKTINSASAVYAGAMAAWNIYKKLVTDNSVANDARSAAEQQKNGYRPDDWWKNAVYAMIDANGNTYVFDAVLKVEHNPTRRITEHPVQTGANITDHSYQLPNHVSFEIGMSDAMDSYLWGQWDNGGPLAKSVVAYQKLVEIQNSGLPVTLQTRLAQYKNMVIENIFAPEDYTTFNSLKCKVHFKEIMTAGVTNVIAPTTSRSDTQSNDTGPRQTGTADNSSIASRFGW